MGSRTTRHTLLPGVALLQDLGHEIFTGPDHRKLTKSTLERAPGVDLEACLRVNRPLQDMRKHRA